MTREELFGKDHDVGRRSNHENRNIRNYARYEVVSPAAGETFGLVPSPWVAVKKTTRHGCCWFAVDSLERFFLNKNKKEKANSFSVR